VAQAAQGTSRGAVDIQKESLQKESLQLVETSSQLRRLVEQFKIDASADGGQDREMAAQAKSMAAYSRP
jgi:hypothetical protein